MKNSIIDRRRETRDEVALDTVTFFATRYSITILRIASICHRRAIQGAHNAEYPTRYAREARGRVAKYLCARARNTEERRRLNVCYRAGLSTNLPAADEAQVEAGGCDLYGHDIADAGNGCLSPVPLPRRILMQVDRRSAWGCATGCRKVVSASSRATLVGPGDNGERKGSFLRAVLRAEEPSLRRTERQRPLLKSRTEEWTSNGGDVPPVIL